ncbi:RDD family protein [Candidatus Micrarchaeota archaeon]|nr:RDD family protein [Candidatus Micrarchaeota archaeon]
MATKKKKPEKTDEIVKKQFKRKVKRRIIEEYVEEPDEEFEVVKNQKEEIEETTVEYEPKRNMYVGFWRRFFAQCIDAVFVSITFGIGMIVNLITEPLYGWTVGKYLLGIRVVSEKTMRPSGIINNWIMRSLIGKCILDTLVLGIGWIWPAFDSKKQAWHDKIAGTIVVYKRFMD